MKVIERIWWRLFQKHVVRTKFDIYVFVKQMDSIKLPKLKLIPNGQILILIFIKV